MQGEMQLCTKMMNAYWCQYVYQGVVGTFSCSPALFLPEVLYIAISNPKYPIAFVIVSSL